nr:hypothetical protein K-LCC10_0396 [Kaumoebavirus]
MNLQEIFAICGIWLSALAVCLYLLVRCIDRAFERNAAAHSTLEYLANQNRLLRQKIRDNSYYLKLEQISGYSTTLTKNIKSALQTYGYYETLSKEEINTSNTVIYNAVDEWIAKELNKDPFLEGTKYYSFNTMNMEPNVWPRSMIEVMPNEVHLSLAITWRESGMIASTEVLGKKIFKQM